MRINNSYARRAIDMVEIGGIDPATKNLITNTVFHWDPYTDHSNYTGKNILLGSIAAEHGISLEYMEKELEQREKVIDWMYRSGITHYKDVAKILKSYYNLPDELLKKVNLI
jgi:flagellar protein FlaI